MERLPDEIYKKIYTYIYPVCKSILEKNKYKYSVLWCKKCGEFLKDSDWSLIMNNSNEIVMTYICNFCKNNNIYVNDDDWKILLDYIN